MAMLLLLISCCKDSEQGKIHKNDKFVPIALTKSQGEITMNVNDLGFDVLSEILHDTESDVSSDLMISPLSLSSALAMCVNGADGSTKDQMLSLLGINDGDIADLNSYYALMLDALVRADKEVDFISANSLWHRPSIILNDAYKKNVSETFDAEVNSADFTSASCVERINGWCSSKTNNMIPVIMTKPDPLVMVKLLNALYFKGMWMNAFDQAKEKPFRHEDGRVSNEKTIVDKIELKCAQTSLFKCVEIPYGNGAYVMNLLLPSKGVSLADASSSLSDGEWEKLTSSFRYNIVNLEFPTFEIKSDIEFSKILMRLGMSDAFCDEADFSNMSDVPLCITSVSQYSMIKVNEKGTEASTVTNIDLGETIAPGPDNSQEEIFEFIADRPFFYIIRESSTGVILFVGKKS